MPRPNFPTENLTDGLQWTDEVNGVVWMCRLLDDTVTGVWTKISVAAGNSQTVVVVPLAEQMTLEPYSEGTNDVLYVIDTAVQPPATKSVILHMPGAENSRIGQQITVFSLVDITSFAVNQVAHGNVTTSIYGYTLGPAMPISFICYKNDGEQSHWLRIS